MSQVLTRSAPVGVPFAVEPDDLERADVVEGGVRSLTLAPEPRSSPVVSPVSGASVANAQIGGPVAGPVLSGPVFGPGIAPAGTSSGAPIGAPVAIIEPASGGPVTEGIASHVPSQGMAHALAFARQPEHRVEPRTEPVPEFFPDPRPVEGRPVDERTALAIPRRAPGLPTHERMAADSRDTVGYPICPIGDSIQHAMTEDKTGDRIISYRSIGWQIITPALGPQETLPSSAIMDVYVGLLWLLNLAGYPEDGELAFSRYEFLHLIGWLSPAKGARGQRTMKPSGRHYDQLKAAFKYLQRTVFLNESQGVQIGPDGKAFRGVQGFPILQYYRLVDDVTGPKAEGRSEPARSMVIFSKPFLQMLGKGQRTTSIDFDLFLSLPMGTPRHLCRLFSWMWQQGISTMKLEEVFQRLGSTQAECVPARARQILTKAHRELEQRGVLTTAPTFEKRQGEWWIQYAFGDPKVVLSDTELLIQQAEAYGVGETTARQLALGYRAQFERVLAGVILGVLKPKKTLPAMIVHYTKQGHEVIDTRGSDLEAQLGFELLTADQQYVAWTARERAARLAGRRDLDVLAIRQQVIETGKVEGLTRPGWVVDGLVAMRMNDALGIESLDEYHERLRAGRVA